MPSGEPTDQGLAHVSGGAALIFLVGLFAWWTLLYPGAMPGQPSGPAGALLFLLPPVVFIHLVTRKGGTT